MSTVSIASHPPGSYVVNASALRLRQSPQVTARMLRRLPRGTEVTVLGQSEHGMWSQVGHGKITGWMATKYLVPLESKSAPVSEHEEFPWMPIALGEVGTREVMGEANNPRVIEYLASTELDSEAASRDSTPWCSGFVNWCVERAGLAGTNSAWARSWLDWGKPVQKPRRGCIAIFSRGESGGHVAFFIKRPVVRPPMIPFIHVLGGNQSNQVEVSGYDEGRLLGYRVPRY